jgi:SAM-dependent methyltransferase
LSKLIGWMDRTFYRAYPHKNWDDAIFRERVLRVLRREHTLLDLGAGAGIVEQMNFKGMAVKVCGLDPDRRVISQNLFLDEAMIGLGETIPYAATTFDVVIADNVLEHLPNPELVFREVFRVLKPGGSFLFKTPNLYHYVPALAQITPLGFHRFINRHRGRDLNDTFPTLYRANSPGRIRSLSSLCGFETNAIELIEGRPEYMRLTVLTYLAGYVYERVVNLVPWMDRFRILMIGNLRKPAAEMPE